MTEKVNDILNMLPARLKEARRAKGLSLEAVANLSGVSRSMVSQIERGESSPTISTLWNLTRALQVDFAGLLENGDGGDRIDVLMASDVPSIDNMGHGCRILILSPPEEAGGHEVYDIAFTSNGVLNSKPHARGAAEQLTVLEGKVRVTSGAAVEDVSIGDTARYGADVTHSIAALGGAARVFLIVKSSGGSS
jgi:transcriptional regulator with XRE-family HTH domain